MSKEQLNKEDQKKQTTFVSTGFKNEQIKIFVEKNPWLLRMDYVDLNSEDELPACWNGSFNFETKNNLTSFLDTNKDLITFCVDINMPEKVKYYTELVVKNKPTEKLLQHFVDWTRPTQAENDYFAMIYGHRLTWSEEEPFIV